MSEHNIEATARKDVLASRPYLIRSIQRASKEIRRQRALLWQRYYFIRYRTLRGIGRFGAWAAFTVLTGLIIGSCLAERTLQGLITGFFAPDYRLSNLRNLLVTLGGALVGATAIGFSVVIFAVQMNFARMPYGLFRRLNSDFRLLGAFGATFFLALAVAAVSLVPDASWVASALVSTFWSTVLIFALFLYAYRRALSLINPLRQIGFMVERGRMDMQAWARRARRAEPLFEKNESPQESEETSPQLRSTHDLARAAYFRINPHWTAVSRQAILHLISFSRRYTEEGDREIATAALSAVLALHTAYIQAKEKTFFTQHLMFNNPLATDEFINESLEHLRQNSKIGVMRQDEVQIEETFRAIAGLVNIYMEIDYSNDHYQSKHHAQLAAAYLTSAVEAVVPHSMTDVLMEGIRLMGQCAQLFLQKSTPNEIVTLADKIAAVSFGGALKEELRPVTFNGMQQLAHLTFNLLVTKNHDIHFAAGELMKNVKLLVQLFLAVPDTPLMNTHSTYLAPYYSLTSTDTLSGWLTTLTNELLRADSSDQNAVAVIHNIEQWTEELYQTQKEL